MSLPEGPYLQLVIRGVVQEVLDLPVESGASSDADAVAVSIEEKAASAPGGAGSEPESETSASMVGTDLSAPSQRSNCQEERKEPAVAEQPAEAPAPSGRTLDGAQQVAGTSSEPGSSVAGEAGRACPLTATAKLVSTRGTMIVSSIELVY